MDSHVAKAALMNSRKIVLFSVVSLLSFSVLSCTGRRKESPLLASSPPHHTVTLQMYRFENVPSQDYEAMVQSHHESLKNFVDLLATECNIEETFSIAPVKTVAAGPGETLFKDVHARGAKRDLPGKAKDFPFQFFQLDLFRLLERHRKDLDRGPTPEISILMMEGLEGNCGFALPQVQFKDVPNRAAYKDIVNSLKNRVLIDTSKDNFRDCVNRTRILSHEIAHVLVQDDPAHMCTGSGGAKVPCPRDNLMASLVWVPVPKKPRPGAEPPAIGDPENFGMRQIQAHGTKLAPDQCEAVKRTLRDIVERK